MGILTAAEQIQIEADCEELVLADGTTVDWKRPVKENQDAFYGEFESSLTDMGTLSGEWNDVGPDSPLEIGGDAYMDVPFDSAVNDFDILIHVENGENVYYRVRHVHNEQLFGAETYKRLTLERFHPAQAHPWS